MKKSRGELVQMVIALLQDKQNNLYREWHNSDTTTSWEDSWLFLLHEQVAEEINQLWIEEYNNA